jgi:tensin
LKNTKSITSNRIFPPIFLLSVPNRSSPNSPSRKNYFYHYINAGIYDVDHKFGDSCRQSLTSVAMDVDSESNRNTIEFDYKRNVIRETSSANCSPKKFLLSSLKRTDSYNANHQHIDDDIEDLELKEASWFHSGLPRESLEALAQKSPGDFIVRRSNNKNGSFTLSLRVPGGSHKIAHYLIVRSHRGYKIKVSVSRRLSKVSHANFHSQGFHKEFSSLRALITHHSVMPESLPVPLALPRPQNINRKCKNIDDYDTYARLKDLRSIFSDLDVST